MSTVVIEPIVGRYLRLDLLGSPHRVYVEEAGSGVPLLCLHTAGADSRQWRALMNDADILRDFRVIAFDLPRHGKSSPPVGWHADDDYKLTSANYVAIILAVMEALRIDQPIVMGCSIGGRAVLHLALHHPERFGAMIGLQSGGHSPPYYNQQWLNRPDIGPEISAAVVSGLIAPCVPDEHRWETLWHYMQAGPGIFAGDLYYYTQEGDIRSRLNEIDTVKCPIYLLTGEYDYSCLPEHTLEVAALLGTDATIMPGLGHFPMSEDPEAFLPHLRPVLAKILAERKG